MRPINLTMQSFGSYGKLTVIDFTRPEQNLFLVTGDTGAGKTTIFDAIVFALYGEASSLANKKEGVVLQSHYADVSQEPYVELTFREGEEYYTVRRVPAHVRKKARGEGVRAIAGSVSLTMPDGSEYPAKETDQKLTELVGLTKSQFMQVAMIAQGEFMELLRAKSDDKKLIFRKLFHTEIYQDIIEELSCRKKEKEKEIAVIRTECMTELGHLEIPLESDLTVRLLEQADRIKEGQLSVMESFLEDLKIMCDRLAQETKEVKQHYEAKQLERDRIRDALGQAQHLLKFFRQKEGALETLQSCKLREEEIKQAETLLQQLNGAYEIRNVYLRYQDQKTNVDTVSHDLEAWKIEVPQLAAKAQECEQQRTKLQSQVKRCDALLQEAKRAVRLENGYHELCTAVKKAQKAYMDAAKAYEEKNAEYAKIRRIYLQTQAGLLAAELQEGEPCPVCGSVHHPLPCRIVIEGTEITKEAVEELEQQLQDLQKKQESTASDARSSLTLKEEKENDYLEAMDSLKNDWENVMGEELPVHVTGAHEIHAEMNRICKKLEPENEQAEKAAKEAQRKLNKAQSLIEKYVQELPGMQKELQERRSLYEAEMNERQLEEAVWQTLTQLHERSEITRIQKKLEDYRQSLATAEHQLMLADDAIGSQPKPELEKLQTNADLSQQEYLAAQESFDRMRSLCEKNQGVYDTLMPRLAKRQQIIREHAKLEHLYKLLSGNVKDGRMDLETFVQRYYLEQILESANKRFLEMSAGQFLLRMVDEDTAGKGRNRGLDLMVFSTVTGKEREVRTLSGGESFMAALALALGMADQIQSNAASIHLDIMFIDEGFGSLDNHARTQAVRVLKEMAGGTRLIGMISHVSELKQEIDDQLIVSKDENGSHARWQIS